MSEYLTPEPSDIGKLMDWGGDTSEYAGQTENPPVNNVVFLIANAVIFPYSPLVANSPQTIHRREQ